MSDDVESAMAKARLQGAHFAVFCELVGMLIEKGVLHQGEVMARYQRLSNKMMSDPHGVELVHLADLVRDFAAAEQNRPPS